MAIFEKFLEIGKGFGLFDYYLPFLITFAMIYALLNKSKIFGDEKKARGINAIIALSAAFYVIAYTPIGAIGFTIGDFFTQFFGGLSVVLVSLLAFVMIFIVLFALTGQEWGGQKGWENWLRYLLIAAALIAIGLYLSTTSGLNLISDIKIGGAIGMSDQDVAIIILLVITVLAIWWLTKGEGKKESSSQPRYVAVQ
jgi:hypothetical protein